MSYKLLPTFRSAISLHFFRVRLTETWHEILKSKIALTYSIRSEMEIVLPTSFLVSQKVSSTQGFTFRPVCCLSYAMIDIDPGETLLFAILLSITAPCSSLCTVILYGGSPLSSSGINRRQAICMALC